MTDLPQMDRIDVLKVRLSALKMVHRELDDEIKLLEDSPAPDVLALRRMKKRKLNLKDQIARLDDEINPDIIA